MHAHQEHAVHEVVGGAEAPEQRGVLPHEQRRGQGNGHVYGADGVVQQVALAPVEQRVDYDRQQIGQYQNILLLSLAGHQQVVAEQRPDDHEDEQHHQVVVAALVEDFLEVLALQLPRVEPQRKLVHCTVVLFLS